MSSDPKFYDFLGVGNSAPTSSDPNFYDFMGVGDSSLTTRSEPTYHDFLGVGSSSGTSCISLSKEITVNSKEKLKLKLNIYDCDKKRVFIFGLSQSGNTYRLAGGWLHGFMERRRSQEEDEISVTSDQMRVNIVCTTASDYQFSVPSRLENYCPKEIKVNSKENIKLELNVYDFDKKRGFIFILSQSRNIYKLTGDWFDKFVERLQEGDEMDMTWAENNMRVNVMFSTSTGAPSS